MSTTLEPEFTETKEYETRLVWPGCTCGHPGLGCYCSHVTTRTGRYRVIRTYKPVVGEWIDPSKEDS